MAKKKSNRTRKPTTPRPAPLPGLDAIDPGTPESHLRRPVEQVTMVEAGKPIRVYRVADALSIMLNRGSITAEEEEAGRAFKTACDIVGYSPYVTVNYESCGGGMSREAFIDRQNDARKKLNAFIDVLGGSSSHECKCLTRVLGWGENFSDLVRAYGPGVDYWSAKFKKGVEKLAKYMATGQRKFA